MITLQADFEDEVFTQDTGFHHRPIDSPPQRKGIVAVAHAVNLIAGMTHFSLKAYGSFIMACAPAIVGTVETSAAKTLEKTNFFHFFVSLLKQIFFFRIQR